MKKYPINEVFCSIQGEGSQAGKRCVFIRFQGCNLKCPYCDTQKAVKKDSNSIVDLEAIVKKIKSYEKVHTLVLTGGEPLLHLDIEFLEAFRENYQFIIQTNGTLAIDKIKTSLSPNDLICCDIKCNSSTFIPEFLQAYGNVYNYWYNVEFKVPVDSTDFALLVDKDVGLLSPLHSGNVYISPIVIDDTDIKELYKSYAKLDLEYTKLNFQIHKLIGVK